MTSTRLLLHLTVIAALLSLAACSTSPALDEEGVKNTLNAFYGAMGRADPAAAMAHLAEDALFVEMGKLETRAEYEKNHLPADIEFEKVVKGERAFDRVTFQGDTAWAVARTSYKGTFEGDPVDFVSAQLAVLSRQDGAWKIRSIHWSSRRR